MSASIHRLSLQLAYQSIGQSLSRLARVDPKLHVLRRVALSPQVLRKKRLSRPRLAALTEDGSQCARLRRRARAVHRDASAISAGTAASTGGSAAISSATRRAAWPKWASARTRAIAA